MGLNIADNFSYLGAKPLDSRLLYTSLTDMVATPNSALYTGIIAFCLENKTFYTYDSDNALDDVTGKWREFLASTSTNNNAEIAEYKENTAYTVNTLVYFQHELCRAALSFTSSSLGNVEDSFEFDKSINALIPFTHNIGSTLNKYQQNESYKKDTFVYYGKLVYRVLQDFTAANDDNIEDAIATDVANENILLINREAEPEIVEYKQNTFYEEDKLVFADGRICRVISDYISDAAGADIEESINIDIVAGHLEEMGENYKFKLYKTSQDLNKEIDGTNSIPASTIAFESNESILTMRVNECIYGPLGTLAIITDIDINTEIITARSISTRDMDIMPAAPDTWIFDILLEGSGYSVGNVIPTDDENVFVEITEVGDTGNILAVEKTGNRLMPTSGAGASIIATKILYGGNAKNWYEIDLEGSAKILPYSQNRNYEKDNLIYFGNILYYATTDFLSDSTEGSPNSSLEKDITDGCLIPIEGKLPPIPRCLGDIADESSLPENAEEGNWFVVLNCNLTLPGQPGIAIKNGTAWEVIAFPPGEMQFPEPIADGGKYFRSVASGETDGEWVKFTGVDGNDYQITINSKNESTDSAYVPAANELVWYTSTDDTTGEVVQQLLIGDGTKTVVQLTPFYSQAYTREDIIGLIGFEPEDSTKKGQPNGYAPLDANGKVPTGNLPDNLVDAYTKDETDDLINDASLTLTSAINTEASRASQAESDLQDAIDTHIDDNSIHVTQTEKDAWNDKVDADDLIDFDNHISDTSIHVTQTDKDKWDGMQQAYFVTNKNDLPTTAEIGNIGYVQTSAVGVTPIVCDQYLWTGASWQLLDTEGVSLSFKWDNIIDKPAATPLTIDNVVTIAHNHANKTMLDKIGQTPGGAFTYDGVEIGIKALFFENDELLPEVGTGDTLYVVYADSRTRQYPSISVYKDGAFQILGKGAQENAPVVGDMQILQAEYYSVQAGSSYVINYDTPNQFFCFLPVEILKEIAGPTNQTITLATFNEPGNFTYNENFLKMDTTSFCTIDKKPLDTTIETVSDNYISYVEVNIDDYKDVESIA